MSKYKQLDDKEWLIQKYEVERQSSKDIAKLIGCSSNLVILALRSFEISVRTNSEARKCIKKQSHKYEQLNDYEWLKQKYLVENLSTKKIAKLIGVKTCNSVRQALIRFNIPLRSISDGLTINREDDGFVLNKQTLDVINGGLLGDAYLRVWNKHSSESYPHYDRTNKFKDHVELNSYLLTSNINNVSPQEIFKYGKFLTYYNFRTLSHKELLPIYRKWYPESSGFKKVIPQDLEINETVLLHWFLDDGCSESRKRKYSGTTWTQKTKQIRIVFCSESFTKEDQEMLCGKITQKYSDLTPKLTKTQFGSGYRIGIPQSQSQIFFNIIGPCPIKSLSYKWK